MKQTIIQKDRFLGLLATLTLVVTTLGVRADTITLNGGISHEGTLLSETPDAVRFEVGKSVKQVRTFKRSEIKSLVVVPPDELAIAEIRTLLPTADFLDANDYRRLIEGSPQKFLSDFPKSTLRAEVEKIITTLETESAKVDDGGVRLNGKWISKQQIAADPYNHEARIALAKLRVRIAKGELLASMREFDSLEKAYVDSTSYALAVGEIKEVLPKHSARLAAQLSKSTRDNKRRETDYSRMGEAERTRAEAAYRRQLAPFLKSHAEAKAAKQKWLDFHVWDLASIADAQEEAKLELARLEILDVDKLASRATTVQKAAALAAEENYIEAWKIIRSLGKIEPGSLAEKINIDIAQHAKEAKKAEETAARAKAAEERAKKAAAREAAAEVARAKENNISKPIPDPRRTSSRASDESTASSTSSDDDEENGDANEDGINFDRTGGEENEKTGGGFSLITVLLVLIPIMGIATFLSIRAAKNNEIEDFVPTESDEEDE